MKVRSKTQFFEMWEAGLLGNRTNLWRDPQEALKSKSARIGFREIRKNLGGAGAWCTVPNEAGAVINTYYDWIYQGRDPIMDDGCPDDKRVLQGELCRTFRGLEGYLDVISKLPMRPAIAAGHMRHCSYATCNALLDKFMDDSSREDLEALLELYPEATIEFSTFSIDVGIFKNRNTLFWETRNY